MKNISIILTTLIALTMMSNAQGWVIQSSPTTQNLHSISYSTANIWVAVGDGGTIIRSSDAGITWTNITSPVVDALYGVSLHNNFGLAVGVSGRVVRTTDSGISWTSLTRPTTRILYSVSITDVSTIATGQEGTLLWSSDIGTTWTSHTAGTASSIFGVSAFGLTAVGAGGQGAVVMSDNGGAAWGLTVLGSQLTFFYGTSFPSASTGWEVGTSSTISSIIIKSIDGGFVWTGQTSPTTDPLYGVSFATVDSGTAVGGNGAIIHTVNSGTTWLTQTSGTIQTLNGVSFANSNLGITVGNSGTILRTTSGGLTGVSHNNNSSGLPGIFKMYQNYPNPFNPSTTIRYQLPVGGEVKLAVYDLLGKQISLLVNDERKKGTYDVKFEGSSVSSGIYYYKLDVTDPESYATLYSSTKKMILVK